MIYSTHIRPLFGMNIQEKAEQNIGQTLMMKTKTKVLLKNNGGKWIMNPKEG